jgi:hypothetical protein
MRNIKILLIFVLFITFSCSKNKEINVEISKYPDGKDFAFTIIDDPDYGIIGEKFIMYDYLDNLGFKTTIPVWVLDNKHGTGEKGVLSNTRGITTTDKSYLKYMQSLQKKGFEICLHTVSPGNDLREETREGYELFKKHFRHYPKMNINHANNLENIYWGGDRFSNKILRFMYKRMTTDFQGQKENSKYFWGDLCKEKTKYVRGWATDNINTSGTNTRMPYHVLDKPYVNYWFDCSDGYNYSKFMRLISDKNIKRLVSEKGTSIIYTHFAYGFVDRPTHSLKRDFQEQLTKISRMNGWFAPASTILDRLLLFKNVKIIKNSDKLVIINNNSEPIQGLTVLTDQKRLYVYNKDEWVDASGDGKIILGTLQPLSLIKIGTSKTQEMDDSPTVMEQIGIVWSWFVGRFNK